MSRAKSKTQVLIFGASGRMGHELTKILTGHPNLMLAATVDSKEIRAFDEGHTAVLKNTPQALTAVLQGADVIIDFSSVKGSANLAKSLSKATDKIVLIGTTGLTAPNKAMIKKVAKNGRHKILMTGNTSLGVATLAKFAITAAKDLAPAGFDVEITETHHRLKVDAPSGTALLLADILKQSIPGSKIAFNRSGKRAPNTIGVHSVRGGGIIGEHQIRFISDFEEVQISHRAFNRSLFAMGALNLLKSIDEKMKSGMGLELIDFLHL